MIDAACISKQNLETFAKCAQPFLNSPRHTTSSSFQSGKVISTMISSFPISTESITFRSKPGKFKSGRGSSQAFSETDGGVDDREESKLEQGEDGSNETVEADGSQEEHGEKDKVGDEIIGGEEQSARTDEIISSVSGDRSIRESKSGLSTETMGDVVPLNSNIRRDVVLSVKAKLSGPVGMTLELNSGPTGLVEKGKVTETLIAMEPERLTVTEPIISNQILKEKQIKMTDFLQSETSLCSKSNAKFYVFV